MQSLSDGCGRGHGFGFGDDLDGEGKEFVTVATVVSEEQEEPSSLQPSVDGVEAPLGRNMIVSGWQDFPRAE